jgi:hypothetical protein
MVDYFGRKSPFLDSWIPTYGKRAYNKNIVDGRA